MNTNVVVPGEIKSLADIEAIETIPLSERDLPASSYEAISRSAMAYPDRLAIRYIEDGDRWNEARSAGQEVLTLDVSYAELLSNIHRTANLFRSLGVQDSDSVSMVLPNVPEAHYTLWGGEACGIVNPINYLLEAGEIGDIVQSAGSKVLVVHGEHPAVDTWQKLPAILERAPCVEHVLVVGSSGVEATPDCHGFTASIQAQNSKGLDFERAWSADAIASLFHTGGTTGLPKLAQHTHGNEVYLAWALNSLADEPGDDSCFLTGLPLFHCNAAIATGLTILMGGGTVLLAGMNGYRTPGIVMNLYALIDHYRIESFAAVPTIYGILSQIPVGDHDLSSINFATCGAAPMPVDLFNNFQKHTGIRLLEGYGLTEATVCSSMTPPDAEVQRIGSIGLRIPFTEMKAAVLDANGDYERACETDEVGVLLIAGPSVTPGYTDKDRNRGLFVSDDEGKTWLNTGDLARQDTDGYFWMTGREKELIIRGGHNIDPKTIEEALSNHPAVNLVAAVGRPDKYAGEIPVAYVDTKAAVDVEELLKFCEENIGERAAVPKAVVILDQLPVTGVGKIHKPTLSLMELETVTRQELSEMKAEIRELQIESVSDKKYGSVVRVNAVCNDDVSNSQVEREISRLLGAYSFRAEITVQ